MQQPIGLGVIGLGRLWEARYKPALLRLRGAFEVVALYDQVAHRAAREARELGCQAAQGIHHLLELPRVEALMLLTPQWFGLYPAAEALRRHKPVFAALDWRAHRAELDSLGADTPERPGDFVPELPRRAYPVTGRLRELLAHDLGPARLILAQTRTLGADRGNDPGPNLQLAAAPLLFDPGGNLIDWCRWVIGAEAVSIWQRCPAFQPPTAHEPGGEMLGLGIEFANQAMAQLWLGRFEHVAWRAAVPLLPAQGFQIYTERGVAWVEPPDRLAWSGPSGSGQEQLDLEPSIGERMILQFHRRVVEGDTAAPTLDDALSVCRLLDRVGGEALAAGE